MNVLTRLRTLAGGAPRQAVRASGEDVAAGSPDADSGFAAHLVREVGEMSSSELSERVIERTRHIILDWVGVAISGAQQPSARIALRTLKAEGGRGVAQVMGAPDRMTARQAALVGGVAGHAQEFDTMGLAIHPSVALLPAIFAVADEIGASGAETTLAIVEGFQGLKILGAAVSNGAYGRGVQTTGVFGALGAAFGVARLLRLDPLGQQRALCIAATQAAGLKDSVGAMDNHLIAGNAAAVGVLSARLAQAGFTARTDLIESREGFANVVNANATDFDPARAGTRLGDRLAVEDIMFKQHAACGGTHSTIEGIRAIRKARPFAIDEIEAVELVVPEDAPCRVFEPATGLEAMFSLRHAAALALTDGDTGPSGFTDALARDAGLARVRRRVTVKAVLPSIRMPTQVSIRLKSGETLTEAAEVFRIRPDDEIPDQRRDLEAKFHGLVDPVLGEARARDIAAVVRRFETVKSVRDLTGRTRLRGRAAKA